jgi:hypothetical protein
MNLGLKNDGATRGGDRGGEQGLDPPQRIAPLMKIQRGPVLYVCISISRMRYWTYIIR